MDVKEDGYLRKCKEIPKVTIEAGVIINLIKNLDDNNRVLFLTGGLKLHFQCSMSESIVRFIMVSVHNLVRIPERLVARGIIAPNLSSFSFHAVARWSMNDALSLQQVLI